MSKTKIAYTCNECGADSNKWQGQCPDCGQWNTFSEVAIAVKSKGFNRNNTNYSGFTSNQITKFEDVEITTDHRLSSGMGELDRVLGGGIVAGSVTLIGGDPGIGKSTILLQTMVTLSKNYKSLYVTGEESLQQVKLRANRLNLNQSDLLLLSETSVEQILLLANKEKPTIMVLDSIQTMHTDIIQSAPGSVGQVRECCAQLVKFAKQNNVAIFLVGHVTKEGAIAGPRVLEHMVDTVLYFEGDPDNKYRLIRACKNRFGSINELGIFVMTEKGLKGVNNPSAIFLSRNKSSCPGSVIMATREGTRSILVEIQALVDESHLANPRRVTVGFDQNRLAMILAVMNRHVGIPTFNQDIFANVVGGVKISETAIDLPVLVAIISSLQNKVIPKEIVFFGEIGLSGEIRPVQNGQERLKEAEKLGFTKAIVPKDNLPKDGSLENLKAIGLSNIGELGDFLRDI